MRTCYTIFAAHADPRADVVLAMAWEQLEFRVATIDDPNHVARFWELEDRHFFKQLMAAT